MATDINIEHPGAQSPGQISATGKLYVETYGCQMNEYDSGLVKTLLKNKAGLEGTAEVSQADVILLNTCAVRENAHSKIYSRLRQLEHLKKKNPQVVFGLLGCMAQNLAEDLWAQNLPLDFIAGPDAYRNLPKVISRIRKQEEAKVAAVDLDVRENYGDILPLPEGEGPGFFVTIMRGCNNFCTFCVVPYTRGRERSRPAAEIVDEVREVARRTGKREVTLLGQNVNSYKEGNRDFAGLVEDILNETDIERIRFTSPHPKDFPHRLLELMRDNKRFCSHIHLPLQAGDSDVLRDMKRNYSHEEFIDLALQMRSMIPDLSLTSDIIVGFPGESEAQFQKTVDVYEQVRFDGAFMFKYSERKGTLAARKFEDDIPDEEKTARLERIVAVQNRISKEINISYHGRTMEVLAEGVSKRSDDDLKGRTLNNKTVIFPKGSVRPGDTVDVKILSSTSATLRGELPTA